MKRFWTVLFWWGAIPLVFFCVWALWQFNAHAASILAWFTGLAHLLSQFVILAVLGACGYVAYKQWKEHKTQVLEWRAKQVEIQGKQIEIEERQHKMRMTDKQHALMRELALAGTLDGSNVRVADIEVTRFLSAGRVTINQESPEPTALPAPQLPAPYDFSQELANWRPTPLGIFLGRRDSGIVTVPMDKLWHVALTGPTGGGKSNILRLILVQLLRLRAACYLCDIHYAPIKRGIDWRPIASRLAHPPIRDISDIAALVEQLARGELSARIDREYRGEPIGDPVYLAIEELPAVMAEKPEIAPHLAKMLRQGRQYDLCFIGATQDMLVKTLGTSSGIRECFRTGYYTGGDMTTARVILDLQKGQTIDEDGLGVEGRVYLKTAMSLAQEVRVPFASSQSVYELLGQHLSPLTDEPAFEHDTHKTTQDLVRDVSLDVRPGEAACESVVSLTAEERLTILTAARAQMAATGKAKVNRSQLLTSQGWNNRMWPKVKQVLDEEGL